MKINKAGVDLVRRFEGCRLRAYPDPGSGGHPWTIGYGSTGSHVTPTSCITQDQAEGYLVNDLRRFEQGVSSLAPVATENQFAAMVSFSFNLGLGNLKTSTLLKKHNAGDYAGAALEFGRWNKASGKMMAGLTARRAAESALYAKADA